jgi:hypothetical protein
LSKVAGQSRECLRGVNWPSDLPISCARWRLTFCHPKIAQERYCHLHATLSSQSSCFSIATEAHCPHSRESGKVCVRTLVTDDSYLLRHTITVFLLHIVVFGKVRPSFCTDCHRLSSPRRDIDARLIAKMIWIYIKGFSEFVLSIIRFLWGRQFTDEAHIDDSGISSPMVLSIGKGPHCEESPVPPPVTIKRFQNFHVRITVRGLSFCGYAWARGAPIIVKIPFCLRRRKCNQIDYYQAPTMPSRHQKQT